MKNLLLADDEKNFLLSLADMFGHYSAEFTVFTANNGKEAIQVIEKEAIDLVITDLKMPEMDGFGLLAHLSSSHPHLPVIVMTAFATSENTNRLDTIGLYQYIEKPLEFQDLLDKIHSALNGSEQGHVTGVSLASFLQLIGLDNKTCTLRIISGEKVGVLYFQDGNLLDAICDNLSGEEAAIMIASWHPVEIDIEESCRKTQKSIDAPLGFILIEGARRQDEEEEMPSQGKSQNVFIDLAEPEEKREDITGALEVITSALTDTLGSIGPMIMQETQMSWENSGTQDSSRLPELIDALCMEIGDSRQEMTFRESITPVLKNAGVVTREPGGKTPSTIPDETDLIALLPQLRKAFTGTIGPRGDSLMNDIITKWGQNGPQSLSRLDELIDLLCTEIGDQDLELFFRQKIAKLL